jgi:hypothetical protein
MLGDEFLQTVQMGDPVAIYEDGTVQLPETTEPPIGFEPTTYGLRNPRCTQYFQEVRVPVDQSCPLERIEELIKELQELVKCCPKCPRCPTGK